MELLVERLRLGPEAIVHRREFLRRHVVLRTPHRARVGITELFRALVRDLDHARVIRTHRAADVLVPALPDFLELRRIAKLAHQGLGIVAGDDLAVMRRAALAVGRLQPGRNVVELGGSARRRGRCQDERSAENVELSRGVRIEALHLRILRGLRRVFDALFGGDRAEIGVQGVRILVDVRVVHPRGVLGDHVKVEQVLLDIGNELTSAFRSLRIRQRGGRRSLRFGCRSPGLRRPARSKTYWRRNQPTQAPQATRKQQISWIQLSPISDVLRRRAEWNRQAPFVKRSTLLFKRRRETPRSFRRDQAWSPSSCACPGFPHSARWEAPRRTRGRTHCRGPRFRRRRASAW